MAKWALGSFISDASPEEVYLSSGCQHRPQQRCQPAAGQGQHHPVLEQAPQSAHPGEQLLAAVHC